MLIIIIDCIHVFYMRFPQVITSQYDQNEYKLASYKVTFLMGSSATLTYICEPSAGWMIIQEAIDKPVSIAV